MTAQIATDIVALIVSVLALLLAAFSFRYARMEYEYKIDPEIKTSFVLGLQIYPERGTVEEDFFIEEIYLDIENENNLKRAYLIHPDHEAEILNINDFEKILESQIKEKINMNRADYKDEENGITYQYEFLFLEGLDESRELYLIYSRREGDKIDVRTASGIQIWSMANSHPDDKEYQGERMMAEEYLEIVQQEQKYNF